MAARVKAVLQYRASPRLRQRLAALDFLTVVVDETDKDSFGREMRDAEILLHVLEPVTAAVIDAAPRLKLIQKIGIGVRRGKAALSSGCKAHPAIRSRRKQSEPSWR